MKLREFVKKSIVEIVEGVKDAQSELKESGAIVNPSAMKLHSGGIKTITPDSNTSGRLIQDLEITVNVNTNSEGGAGIMVLDLINLGLKKNQGNMTSLTFNIPISLPVQEVKYTKGGWVAT
jgi:hypothetical protein